MVRTARKPGPPTVVFGVYGQGEASAEVMADLLGDYIEGLNEITPKFVIPLGKVETTPTIQDLVLWVEDAGYTYEAIHVDPYARTKVLKEIGEGAAKVTKVDDIGVALAERLGSAPEARLLFLWADDSEGEPLPEDQAVLFQVMDAGVVALDLTGGLEEIPNDEPPAEDEPAADEEGGDGEAAAYDGPGFEEVDSWPVRKVRSFALDEEMHGDRVLTPDQTSEMTKDEILEHFFPEEFDGEAAEEEPAPAPKKTRATPSTESAGPARGSKARATQIREDAEEETGEEVTRPAARKAAAAAKKTADGPVARQRARDAGKAEEAMDRVSPRKTKEEPADEAQALENAFVQGEPVLDWEDIADKIADRIIDRIAERVKSEPEDSEFRKEIAPTRPPGRPRADGKPPVRSRRS